MDISAGNITGKLTKHAELLAILASGYEHSTGASNAGSGFTALMNYLQADFGPLKNGPLNELKNDMKDPIGTYWYKLWKSGHLYSSIFKVGLVAYAAGALGLYTKYESLGKKLMKAGAISAAIFQGSGPGSSGSIQGFNQSVAIGTTAGQGSYRGASNMGNRIQGY